MWKIEEDLKLEADEFTPLRDVVCNSIRRAILTGQMEPGTRLLEVHLADTLGVSRTPVREAIRKLEQEGLVIIRPRRGAEVARITAPQMRDMMEVRIIMDVLAAKLAAGRADAAAIEEIKAVEEQFEEEIRNGDLHSIVEADTRFHAAIAAAGGNRKLIEINREMEDQVNRYRYETDKIVETRPDLVREHTAVIKAIEAGDPEAAGIAARAHVTRQVDVFLKKFPEE